MTSNNEASDFSPNLFRLGSDPGLNIFSINDGGPLTFTEGVQAFVGSATWTLNAAAYNLALAGSNSGNIFFPADTVDDLDDAFILGSYAVTLPSVAVPEPTALALMLLGLFGLCFSRAKKNSISLNPFSLIPHRLHGN